MVMIIIAMVVLLGFAGFAIDTGSMAHQKSELQNAADAAALAAAKDLPNFTTAKSTGDTYAKANGANEPGDTIIVNAPYPNVYSKNKVEVVCSRDYENTFLKVLGLNGETITVRAVAETNLKWDGQSLPFINMEGGFSDDDTFNVWEKVDSGLFESILKYEVEFSEGAFNIEYKDGIQAKEGKLAEGTDNIKTNLADMWAAYQANPSADKYIYVFSLSDDVFDRHYVKTDKGNRSFEKAYDNNPYKKIGQADNILYSEIVILECVWTNYDEKSKIITLEYNDTYDLGNNDEDKPYKDFPIGQDGKSAVGTAKLIQ